MSLFVHYDNQTILWETIQQHPYVTIVPPTQRASWFKQHIQSIYEQAPAAWFASPMTTEKLNHVNQQAMQYMINDLKMMVGAGQQQPQPQQQQQQQNQGNRSKSSINSDFSLDMRIGPSRPMNDRQQGGGEQFKDKSLYDQFLQKQQDIESMLQNKQVNPIDFKIAEIDEPITNIDELIQRQLRDRELDVVTPIHQYLGNEGTVEAVPPPTPTTIQLSQLSANIPPSFQTNSRNVPKPLKIDSDNEEILELQVQEIKHVEFQIPNDGTSLDERFKQLDERMQQQSERLKQMDERIQVLVQIQKQYLEQVQKSNLFENPSDLVGLLLGLEEEDQDQEEVETSISIEESEP